jgi:hypothetical protein
LRAGSEIKEVFSTPLSGPAIAPISGFLNA